MYTQYLIHAQVFNNEEFLNGSEIYYSININDKLEIHFRHKIKHTSQRGANNSSKLKSLKQLQQTNVELLVYSLEVTT